MLTNNDADAEVEFEYTGKGCVPKDVTIVRFHPSVTEVENHAFYNCSNLRELQLNEGLQKIGQSAFWICTSLASITLPSTVTEVCSCAFHNCTNLREVEFNVGLKKIGRAAFYSCRLLSSVIFPHTVTEILLLRSPMVHSKSAEN